MGVDLAVVGKEFPPVEYSWDERDAILYALGVGAGANDPAAELQLTTENSEGVQLEMLPTFAVLKYAGPGLSDLGDFALSQLLHGEQSVRIHEPLPVSGTVRVTGTVTAIHDKGTAAFIETANRIESSAGQLLAETTQGLFVRGEGGFGGNRGPSDAWSRPERTPDRTLRFMTRRDQALLYRLSGDANPLHSDPVAARKSGFERPILHGLCTFGIAGRLLTESFAGGRPRDVKGISARFASPVLPGEQLSILAWDTPSGVLFQGAVDDKIVLDRGVFTCGQPIAEVAS